MKVDLDCSWYVLVTLSLPTTGRARLSYLSNILNMHPRRARKRYLATTYIAFFSGCYEPEKEFSEIRQGPNGASEEVYTLQAQFEP